MTSSGSSPPSQPSEQQQALLGISVVFRIEAKYNAVMEQSGMSPALAGGGEAYRPEVGLLYFPCYINYSKPKLSFYCVVDKKITTMFMEDTINAK